MRLLLVAFSLCVLVSFSSFASAACPAKAAMPAWEDGELLALAYQIEKDEYKTEASAQKLSWRHYDKSCNFKSEYSTNGVDLGVYYYDSTDKKTGHTEFQMMRDANFNAQAAKGGYMFIWSTQAPCVVGSASTGRKACSDEVPGFLQTNYPGTKFIFGFSARKFARHEYKAMVAEGLDTDWDAFAGVLTKKWKGSKNANLLAYNGDKKMTFNDWVELAFLETDAVTTFKAAERRFSLRNKLRKNKALAPPTPSQTTTSSQSSNGDEIPAHKKVLVAALEGGAKYPLSFVLGKEDGTIAKEVTQGLAVPTPLPPGAVYIAVFANPLLENVEQFFKLANSVASAGGRVNIVFKTTSPLLMPVSPAGLMDNQQKKTPLQKENLRLFTLLGSNHVPKRIWPSKAPAPAAPGAPAPPSAPAATAPTSPKATKGK